MTRWLLRSTVVRCLLAGTVLLAAVPARAARTFHLFLDESQLVPEGDVELEQWVWSNGRIPSRVDRPASIWVWWGPVVSVSSHLELELPLQIVSVPEHFYLHSIELVARYRLFPRERDGGIQPLIRVAYGQPLSEAGGPPTLEVTLVATYGALDALRLTVNAGAVMGMPFLQSNKEGSFSVLGKAGAGVSLPVGKELRLATEFFSQFNVHGQTFPAKAQLYLGPSISWTRGIIWVTFGSLFGLTNDSSRFTPRVLWGVAL